MAKSAASKAGAATTSRAASGASKSSAASTSRAALRDRPVWLYLGPEIGEKEDAVNDIRKRLGAGLEEQSFYAGETPVNQICGAILNGSLFADSRLFIIKNAEGIKKSDAEQLALCLESPPPGTALVLVSDETKLDARLEKAVDAKNRRVFWELFEDRKIDWVRNHFRREGFRISDDGIETLLELVENNTDALRRECSRLCLFLDKGNVIGPEELEALLAHSREESAFTLFSRIAAGDLSRSIETLHTLLAAKNPPQAIFAGLVYSYRRFRDYLALTAEGTPDDFAYRRAGFTSPRARKDYASLSRRLHDAAPALALIAEFDLLLRSGGSALEEPLMDLLVCKLVTEPERPRERWYWY